MLVEKTAQKSAAHGAWECQKRSGSQEITDQTGGECHGHTIAGAKEYTGQNINKMLYGSTAGDTHRNGKGGAHNSNGYQETCQGQFLYIDVFHFLPPVLDGRYSLVSSHSGTRIPSQNIFVRSTVKTQTTLLAQ